MKRFLGVSIALAMALTMTVAVAAEPQEIVRETTDNVLARVKNDKDTLRADPGKMFDLVSQVIFPHFDFDVMSQWVLGDSWAGADEAKRTAFIAQFRKLLVRTYATALLEFSDQTITYPTAEQPNAANTATVRQEISQPGAEVLPVVYRLHNKTGDWKVFDVSVDGVSLIKTYRASFGSMIKTDGLDGLIKSLDSKNQQYASHTR